MFKLNQAADAIGCSKLAATRQDHCGVAIGCWMQQSPLQE
jgi:hypothetical protein